MLGEFLLTLAVGILGGYIFIKMRVPSGAMIGAMVGVTAFNLISESAFFPDDMRIILQLFSGIFIGSSITWQDILDIKKVIMPFIILVVAMIFFNVTLGFVMWWGSNLDLATALLSITPGGASDMALIAEDFGANPGYVAILQSFRLIVIIVGITSFFKQIVKRMDKKEKSQKVCWEKHTNSSQKVGSFSMKPIGMRTVCTVLCGCVGGLLLRYIGLTAGALLGGMIGAAFFNVTTEKGHIPKISRLLLQMFAGAYIGTQTDRASLITMGELLIPLGIIILGIFFYCIITAFIMYKLTSLDFGTCLLASSPGGIQEMSLLAIDLGIDPSKVAIIHTARVMVVIAMFPALLAKLTFFL